MKRIKIEIKGVAPLLLHNGDLANPFNPFARDLSNIQHTIEYNEYLAEQKIEAEKMKRDITEKPKVEEYHTYTSAMFPGNNFEFQQAKTLPFPKHMTKKFDKKSTYVSKVQICFNVETDGSITNVELISGIDEICDEQAINLVKSMPNWIPAKTDGVSIPSSNKLYVIFTNNL